MSKRLIAAVAAVAVVLAAAGSVYLHYRNSPGYALTQIRSAMERHDRLRFERYVDVDRFSTALVDQLMGHLAAESFRQASGSENGVSALGSALGVGLLERLKPAMVEAIRSSVREGVQNGSLATGLFAKPAREGEVDVQRLGSQMGVGKDVFLGVGGIRQDGGTALVDLRVRPILLDTVLTVTLRMEKEDGTWRVVAPDNLTAYLATLSRLQQAKLATLNDAARARLKELVSFGPVSVVPQEIGYETWLRLEVSATNRGREPIESLLLVFGDATSASELEEMPVGMDQGTEIAPGASHELDGNVEYNQFSDFHKHLRYGSVSAEDASAFYLVVGAARADTVKVWTSWEEYAAHEALRPVHRPTNAGADHQAGVSRPSERRRDG